MDYTRITIPAISDELKEHLIAVLEPLGFTGYEETSNSLVAYIPSNSLDFITLSGILNDVAPYFTDETIPDQNWNELWESNFQPVILDDFCTIRAHFHEIVVTTPYEIQVTPKMSFGTGHHATTRLVLQAMRDIDFVDKEVLDFGTGTGILAIMAEMLGAIKVEAIDNDEWSILNATENCERNNARAVKVALTELTAFQPEQFNVILANINRNVLLEHMGEMMRVLKTGGTVVMSGILIADSEVITAKGQQHNLNLINATSVDGWQVLTFCKHV